MSEQTLLPCPFCGSAPAVVDDNSYGDCLIFCNCEPEPCVAMAKENMAGAIAQWNRRPAPVAQPVAMIPVEILERFPEINPSNYGHDDVCNLNSWGVEVVLAATEPKDKP